MDVEAGTVMTNSVIVDGATVDYHVAGTASSPSTPVVLVHGVGGSTQAHMSYMMPMLARRHRVISVDLAPPVGDAPLTIEALAGQVAAVVEREVPGTTVGLLGYSLGAVVATVVAGIRPDLIDRLVLINGWVRTDPQQRMRLGIWRKLREEGSAALKEFATFCSLSGEYMDLIQPVGVRRAVADAAVDDFADRQVQLAARVDIADHAFAVAAPTLVIGSSKDVSAPPRHARALFGCIDDARYLEVAAGHAALQERPAEVLRAAEDFLDYPARHAAGTELEPLRP